MINKKLFNLNKSLKEHIKFLKCQKKEKRKANKKLKIFREKLNI